MRNLKFQGTEVVYQPIDELCMKKSLTYEVSILNTCVGFK